MKPDFKPSGILLEYYGNVRNGKVLKFHEPVDKADPAEAGAEWCLFEFRDDNIVDEGKHPLLLEGQTVFLIGSDPLVCDFLIQDPESLENGG